MKNQTITLPNLGARLGNEMRKYAPLMILIGLVVGNWESIMNHIDRWRRPAHAADMLAAQEVEYYCGMHPFVISDRQSKCPICGMDLVLKKTTGALLYIPRQRKYLMSPARAIP